MMKFEEMVQDLTVKLVDDAANNGLEDLIFEALFSKAGELIEDILETDVTLEDKIRDKLRAAVLSCMETPDFGEFVASQLIHRLKEHPEAMVQAMEWIFKKDQ